MSLLHLLIITYD